MTGSLRAWRRRRRHGRQGDDEREPAAGCLLEHQGPGHGLHQAAGERQAEAEPGGAGVAEPLERQEHPVPVGHRDAGAGVDDPQLDAAVDGVAVSSGGAGRRSAARWPPG